MITAKRGLSPLVLATALGAAGALGAFTPSVAHAGDDACTTKKFHFKKVEEACKEGGRKAAKKLMKSVVKKARGEGTKLKCKSCHESTKTFELKDNAVEDLKKWI